MNLLLVEEALLFPVEVETPVTKVTIELATLTTASTINVMLLYSYLLSGGRIHLQNL